MTSVRCERQRGDAGPGRLQPRIHALSRREIVAALSALALQFATCGAAAAERRGGEVGVGQLLREATLRGLNGPPRLLSSFRGQPLIINVWASWCGPCRQEMASLERLAWQPHAVPFTIIGISTDDDPDSAMQLLKTANATLSHFIDSHLALETMLGASRLPLTVLVDPDGRVVDKVYGAKEWDGHEASVLITSAFGKRAARPT